MSPRAQLLANGWGSLKDNDVTVQHTVWKLLDLMSSDDGRVIVRAVRLADRAAWETLFHEYRKFYKLPHDAAVCLFVFVFINIIQTRH